MGTYATGSALELAVMTRRERCGGSEGLIPIGFEVWLALAARADVSGEEAALTMEWERSWRCLLNCPIASPTPPGMHRWFGASVVWHFIWFRRGSAVGSLNRVSVDGSEEYRVPAEPNHAVLPGDRLTACDWQPKHTAQAAVPLSSLVRRRKLAVTGAFPMNCCIIRRCM